MRIVLATENGHKLAEMRAILTSLAPDHEFLALTDLQQAFEMPEETGNTLAENAEQKAEFVANATGLASIGDDSGLFVDALNGRPGVYSRRWAGSDATDADRIAKVLDELDSVGANELEQRSARFLCAAALAFPEGNIQTFVGECAGWVLKEPQGVSDFGYDPIFYVPSLRRTMAQLNGIEKNKISHRARALRQLALSLPSRV